MPKRVNDIILSPPEYVILIKQIEEVFRQRASTTMPFTGSRHSTIYTQLANEIREVSDIILSNSFLLNLMTLKHNRRFQKVTYEALQKFARSFSYLKNEDSLAGTQKIYWGVNQGLPPGAYVDNISGEFIPWKKLKGELEKKVINRYPKLIAPNSKAEMADFYGRKNWLIHITDKDKKVLGSVWIGSNPYANWENDGLVRIGKSIDDNHWIVYAVFARLPDGTYKSIKIYTEREINILLG